MVDRKAALNIVISCLRDSIEQLGGPVPDITEETVIVGKDAVLDSVGVVSLIVDIEQKLESEHSVAVTLASDKAMSQKNSPFRTAGVLAEYMCQVIQEGQAA